MKFPGCINISDCCSYTNNDANHPSFAFAGQPDMGSEQTVVYFYRQCPVKNVCQIWAMKKKKGKSLQVCKVVVPCLSGKPVEVIVDDDLLLIGPQMQIIDFKPFVVHDEEELRVFSRKKCSSTSESAVKETQTAENHETNYGTHVMIFTVGLLAGLAISYYSLRKL